VTPSVVIPTFNGRDRLERLLLSLAPGGEFEVVVVDNASGDETAERVRRGFPAVELVELPENRGFGRAVNAGVAAATGDPLVFLNNDCVCDPEFVPRLAAAIEPGSGAVMAAGVLRNRDRPELIDTAGICVDSTLLVYDYLNGQLVSVLEGPVADPLGPCGAAAAFDRAAFLEAGGFDEELFAYWEDVDLALRLRVAGATCALVRDARGTHDHAATLGSGSKRKNYLMGFGRGYVLRKWGVVTPRRLPKVLAREFVVCAGQAVLDRNLAGVAGRRDGYRAGRGREGSYPRDVLASNGARASRLLADRLRRRLRLRRAHG
jgi:N-acetylglucosaminyl-diphospho-decaprenol L-rhamnosyltransferase